MELKRRNPDKTFTNIGVFAKAGNTWTLEDVNKVRIIIVENPVFPFIVNEELIFNVLSETLTSNFK